MNIPAENFAKMNGSAIQTATMLLNKIISDNSERIFSPGIVIDIGCGTGYVTKHFLAKSVAHKKILAYDIDPAMIDYARQNFTSSSIEYLLEDFGKNFNNLDCELQSLEHQVDLIFANYVLHWIPGSGKLNSVVNIKKLLKPGGRFYGAIVIVNDVEEFIDDDEKMLTTKGVLEVPSRLKQLAMWEKYFKSQNLLVEFEVVNNKYDFGSPVEYQRNWGQFMTLWGQYSINNKKYEENVDKLKELFLRSYGGYRQMLTSDKLTSTQTAHMETIIIKCTKI